MQETTKVDDSGRPWRLAAFAIGAVFAMLFIQWQIINNTPPTWDEAFYLIKTWLDWDATRNGGLMAFYKVFLTGDRPGLLSLLGVPGFFVFGPSAKAAIIPFAVLWILSTVAICDFTSSAASKLFDLDDKRAGISAFFAVLIFALYPMTQYKAQYFFVEFLMITVLAALNALALRFWLTGKIRYAALSGLAFALGFLTKVTFPAFALAATGLVLHRLYRQKLRSQLLIIGAMIIPTLIIALPFYINNFSLIAETTRLLASAEFAAPYGLGGAGRLMPSLAFIWLMLRQYEFLLCIIFSFLFLVYIWSKPQKRRAFFLIAISSLIPFLVIAFSNFKIERYAYPGYIGLFTLAGCGISMLWRLPKAVALCLTILIISIPAAKTAVVYQFLPAEISRHITNMISKFGFTYYPWPPARLADNRDWKIKELSQAVEKAKRVDGPIFLLGESTAFHVSLMIFSALTYQYDQRWVTFPHHSYPQMTAADLLNFLRLQKPSVVLFKSPPYDVAFLARHLDVAFSQLSNSVEYDRTELPVTQPDGAKFTIFSRIPAKE